MLVVTTTPTAPVQSKEQVGPYRPLFVESEEVKVRYVLQEDEVRTAIMEWLENEHEVKGISGIGDMVAIVINKTGGEESITDLFNTYSLAIEAEAN